MIRLLKEVGVNVLATVFLFIIIIQKYNGIDLVDSMLHATCLFLLVVNSFIVGAYLERLGELNKL